MSESDARRLITLEANAASTAKGIDDIKQYLTRRSEQHLEVMQSLAVIKSKQEDFSEYTKDCSAERKEIHARLITAENALGNMTKLATAVASGLALTFTGAIEWFRK